MTVRADPIAVVEAAYAWPADERAWATGLVESCKPYEVGGGVLACTVAVGKSTSVSTIVASANVASRVADELVHQLQTFSTALARRVLAPTELVGNAAHRLLRIARQTTGATATAARRTAARLPPMWAVIGGDPEARAVILCFPAGKRGAHATDPYPHPAKRALGMVGAHLDAALRLRAHAQPSAESPDTDAVLTPTGKLLHAAPAARSARTRESLADAVIAMQRARRSPRHVAPDEALAAWTALVSGKWTILEVVERDGKRVVLARRNRLARSDVLALSDDERDVLWLTVQGHSYKYIAYELGVPLSTVANRLRRAMRKLRVSSRTELLRKLGTQ